jgi:hypothetical protein
MRTSLSPRAHPRPWRRDGVVGPPVPPRAVRDGTPLSECRWAGSTNPLRHPAPTRPRVPYTKISTSQTNRAMRLIHGVPWAGTLPDLRRAPRSACCLMHQCPRHRGMPAHLPTGSRLRFATTRLMCRMRPTPPGPTRIANSTSGAHAARRLSGHQETAGVTSTARAR